MVHNKMKNQNCTISSYFAVISTPANVVIKTRFLSVNPFLCSTTSDPTGLQACIVQWSSKSTQLILLAKREIFFDNLFITIKVLHLTITSNRLFELFLKSLLSSLRRVLITTLVKLTSKISPCSLRNKFPFQKD